MNGNTKDCISYVERLSDLDPDDPLNIEDKEFFIRNRETIVPLMRMYEWDSGFLLRLLALSE